MKAKPKPKQPPNVQEQILEQMQAISAGVKKLWEGPINDRAILLLLQDAIGNRPGTYRQFGTKDIQAVLDGMAAMESHFLKSPEDYERRNET